MAQLTWYLKAATGNWNAANAWNDAADGSGTDRTNPQNGADTYICDLNAKAVSINVAVSVDQIRTGGTNAGGTIAIPNSTAATIAVATAAVGLYSNFAGTMLTWGTGTSSLTINGDVTYAGTSTAGMILVPTGTNLTINGQVTNTAAGYAVVTSGTGVLTITNVGGTAVSNTGANGRGVNAAGSGAIITNGLVTNSGTGIGRGVHNGSTSTGGQHNGNLSASVAMTAYYVGAAGIITWTPGATGVSAAISGSAQSAMHIDAGTVTISTRLPTTTETGIGMVYGRYGVIFIRGGTLNCYGNYSLAANAECSILLYGDGYGTLNLVQQSGAYTPLNLANSGTFVIRNLGGAALNAADKGAGAASIVNQTAPSSSAGAFAAILGGTAAQRGIITGPTLPAPGNVRTGSGAFGYPGEPLTPTFSPGSVLGSRIIRRVA